MNPDRRDDDLPGGLRSLRRTFMLGYRAEPRLLTLSIVMTFVMFVPDALILLWLRLLADGVSDGDRSKVIASAIGLAASNVATWYLAVVFDRTQRRFRDRVSIALEAHVAELQASVATIAHQERPEYLDRLSVLRDQVFSLDHLFISLFSTIGWLVRLGVTVALLVSIHPVLVLLVGAAVPIVMISAWRPAIERRTEEANAGHKRLSRHLFALGTTAASAKEVRVARVAGVIERGREEAWGRWFAPVQRQRNLSAAWKAGAWAVFSLAYVAAIIFVAEGLDASPGQVLLVLAGGSRLAMYVGSAVGELGFLRGIWLDSSRRLVWLEDYAALVAPPATNVVPARLTDGIRFEHVSFRYPGADRLVLDDVDLVLPAGRVVAIVGENGAGKTTLVKLLCRLYEPTAGRIEVDGVPLATLGVDEWRERLSGAFQDFFRFEFRARQTVGVGDLPHLEDEPVVVGAVSRAGADDVVERLPSQLATQLGPAWDGGVELSHGQWQKLALARGFMRDDPLLLVLDEPTSALDAETEHALFERYADAARARSTGAITVLVSHRFSTVRMADLIVVMDGARVVEVGSHEALMARNGQYAELYSIQAQAFRT